MTIPRNLSTLASGVDANGVLGASKGGTGSTTTFTLGSVVFVGASGVYAQDNSNLFWDNTNKRLGIGTATPAAPLNVSVSTSGDAVRITQTGAGNALVVEDSTNPDATPFVVNASGQVLIGRTTAPFGSTSLGIEQSSADTAPSNIDFLKNRAGAIVNSGDGLGRIRFWGYDGASNIDAAEIVAAVDGTPGTNDMPGRLVFLTTADGASSPTERFRIGSSGQLGIGGANYGTSGQVLTSNGSAAAPSWQAAATTGINYQSFTSSGTWTKPAGYAAGSRAFIQLWGAGGGGAKNGTNNSPGGGAGGGAYVEIWVALSALGATETVTIGAGGTAGGATGGVGGSTTFGSILTAYGGGGGFANTGGGGSGGGGGGQLAAGATGTTLTGGAPGQPWQGDGGACAGIAMSQGGAVGSVGGPGFWAGGGGGSPVNGTGAAGGKSYYGGGGGGGGGTTGSGGTGGTSVAGGAGGAGSTSGAATAGSQPGGGGGGTYTGTAAAGAAGECRVTVFPA